MSVHQKNVLELITIYSIFLITINMADWVTFSMIKDYFYTSLESMEKGKVPKMHTIDITVNEKTWLWF